MKKPLLTLTAAALACLAIVACSQKGPAEAAINAAEQSVNQAKPEIVKYVPDQFKTLAAALAGARDSFGKGDYATAIKTAQEIPGMVQTALVAAAAKKVELTKAWDEMNASIPAMLDAIKTKVDALSAMKKLPKGMDAAKLASAKAGYDAARGLGSEAMEAFKAGNVPDAVAKAKVVKDKVADVMAMLGMNATAAAPATAPAAAAPAAAKK